MGNMMPKRGIFPTVENTADAGTTLSERLQSVLRRIQDRSGDAPVVVSAGLLRWIAEASSEKLSNADAADLYRQIEQLTHELENARESAAQAKGHSDRVSEQLQLANVRVATLTEHVTKLRQALAGMTRKSAATNNK